MERGAAEDDEKPYGHDNGDSHDVVDIDDGDRAYVDLDCMHGHLTSVSAVARMSARRRERGLVLARRDRVLKEKRVSRATLRGKQEVARRLGGRVRLARVVTLAFDCT